MHTPISEHIEHFGQQLQAAAIGDNDLDQAFAAALGWSADETRAVDPSGIDATFVRGSIGTESAALFRAVRQPTASVSVADAALYAYHASISWGLVAALDGIILFNSHWIRREGWFQLPLIPWQDLASGPFLSAVVTTQPQERQG